MDKLLFATMPLGTARMLRSDLKGARRAWIALAIDGNDEQRREKSAFLGYENAAGQIADFHGKRISRNSWLVGQP